MMAAYRRVYDSRHLQADCQAPRSALEPYSRQLSMGYLFINYSRSMSGPLGHPLPVNEPGATGMVIVARWPLENNLSV